MFNFFKRKKATSDAPVGITELVFRDAHQSLLATRLRIDDILPIAAQLDEVGYWSVESWGGATFDACIRYLGEDPWDRIKEIKKAMPKTPQQMLLRGQNLLGYRHYADDVVRKFIDKSVENGIAIFRIFDAMNDVDNLKTAISQTIKLGGHAQGTISYTVSPVHTIELWADLAKKIEDMGAHSLCIKDMAGLLQPYVASELVQRLKKEIHIPIQLHAHATTGLSTASIIKAVEAGIDRVDTAIGSMSMTYGHSATNSIVSILDHSTRKTHLDLEKLEEIDSYFRSIRVKYSQFEGSLRGVDSRILLAQVPGGMLTNMENQLKEQQALDKMDEVLLEIPRVREDLGYVPLVTPTSQIIGTQSVLNVLSGQRYKTITKEAAGVLKGKYGKTPAAVNQALQDRVLDGKAAISCRPADLLPPELDLLADDLARVSADKGIKLEGDADENLLTYALFPQVALAFFANKHNPDFFEPKPVVKTEADKQGTNSKKDGSYIVSFKGQTYTVSVSNGEISDMYLSHAQNEKPQDQSQTRPPTPSDGATGTAGTENSTTSEDINAPLAGTVFGVKVATNQSVKEGDVLLVLEAMKMETEIRASSDGMVVDICVKEGDTISVGDKLLSIASH